MGMGDIGDSCCVPIRGPWLHCFVGIHTSSLIGSSLALLPVVANFGSLRNGYWLASSVDMGCCWYTRGTSTGTDAVPVRTVRWRYRYRYQVSHGCLGQILVVDVAY